MKLIDRLIDKAKTIKLSYGDNVFIISNETGKWVVEGQEFPDLEAAQEYVESLLPDDALGSTVIINDTGPDDPYALKKLTVPADWIDRLKQENMERMQRKREAERLNRPPEKDRRLI